MSYFKKFAGIALASGIAISSMATSAFAASIISFNGPAGEAYIGKFIKGIKHTAELGFDIIMRTNLTKLNKISRFSGFSRSIAGRIYLVAIGCCRRFRFVTSSC